MCILHYISVLILVSQIVLPLLKRRTTRHQPRLTVVCVVTGCISASHHTTKGLARPILSTRAACGCSASQHITWRHYDLAQPPGATYPTTEKLAAFGMWPAAVSSFQCCFTSTHHAHYLGFHDVHLFFAPEFRACGLCLQPQYIIPTVWRTLRFPVQNSRHPCLSNLASLSVRTTTLWGLTSSSPRHSRHAAIVGALTVVRNQTEHGGLVPAKSSRHPSLPPHPPRV